ncbi:unnamed protein product [Rotaria socialis]|uniref:Peptidase C14 caspase domain-containing protein n=2 Tax=Rotaria socialis TaxID=392032 RepID=A0A818FBX5_9BILA|nr:unnamed protein product [Rotaria socialis]CAF3472797.1 unnamed protein product [Rotaria socialis]CAF3729388.1 unnamed protein product [Rotaria socialis]CAF3742578.1 unnamed protein product [Rotaria socialis]CAF4583704.1 unnamed protein product [Rotaria socialis]
MPAALKSIGFIVTPVLHPTRGDMKRILVEFEDSIEPGDIVLFYFAVHGTQWEDQNYLLPKHILKIDGVNLNRSAINAQNVLNTLSDRDPFVTIFLLDCCRNYHKRNTEIYARGDSSDSKSADFKPMDKTRSLIAFACASGTIVMDGQGQRNGLFTKHILEHTTTPNEDISLMLRDVRQKVVEASNLQQIPFVSDGLLKKNIFLYEQHRCKQ